MEAGALTVSEFSPDEEDGNFPAGAGIRESGRASRHPHRLRLPLEGERGFTLLETMVAVMILAVSLVIVLQLLSENLRSTRLSEDYTRGISLARMKMEELLVGETPGADLEGDFGGGYAWTASFTEPPPESASVGGLAPFELTVEVRWSQDHGAKSVSLSTIRLYPSPEGER
ncbi:MAG: type IV pilus modification PilV family protein [Desulfobacterales bacterium]